MSCAGCETCEHGAHVTERGAGRGHWKVGEGALGHWSLCEACQPLVVQLRSPDGTC